ncbi:MAG: cohesin domain-containing protein, partial [bacterium]|nr:cohesin domain-containing protein [bacterium]
ALSLSIIFLVCFTLLSTSNSSNLIQSPAVSQAQEQQEKTTTLTVSASTVGSAVIKIDSDRDKVAAIKLHLSFDPKAIKVDSINPGSFFTKTSILQKVVDNKTGNIEFVFGSMEPKAGMGDVAVIKYSELKESSELPKILQETEVSAIGKTYNVLK